MIAANSPRPAGPSTREAMTVVAKLSTSEDAVVNTDRKESSRAARWKTERNRDSGKELFKLLRSPNSSVDDYSYMRSHQTYLCRKCVKAREVFTICLALSKKRVPKRRCEWLAPGELAGHRGYVIEILMLLSQAVGKVPLTL